VPGLILQDLLIGVTEAVTNAQRYGEPPATVRIWAAGERIVVTIHDTGYGPAAPLAGLVPLPGNTPRRHLGMGLWVVHQLDIEIALRRTSDGFTVRLRNVPGSPAAEAFGDFP
jgi:anti-sigma regulatory factor (Ser/Thr protein kinase)